MMAFFRGMRSALRILCVILPSTGIALAFLGDIGGAMYFAMLFIVALILNHIMMDA